MPRDRRSILTLLGLGLAILVTCGLNLQQERGISFVESVRLTLVVALTGLAYFGLLALLFVSILWVWRWLRKALALAWRRLSSVLVRPSR